MMMITHFMMYGVRISLLRHYWRIRLGMVSKTSNVMGNNPVTLHRIWRILIVRRIDDLAGFLIGWPLGWFSNRFDDSFIGWPLKIIILPADEDIIGSS
jgi:hypothetical protein